MRSKQRKQQLLKRQRHTADQNTKRKAGEKSDPRPKRKQPRKPRPKG